MKKVGINAGILLILLIGSALVVPSFVDWNKYKTEIEMTATDLSGRNVAISGDLSLSILPSPSFSAADVTISNVEGGQAANLIELKSVDVNVAFFPLLSGNIQVKKFILVEPIVALEVDENGRGNWEFGGNEPPTEASRSTTELSFEQFQIENGQVSYQDIAKGHQELVRGINASVAMDSLQGPFEVSGDARYKNLPVSTELMVGTIRDGRKVPFNVTVGFLENKVEVKFNGGVLLDESSPQADGKINLNADDIGDILLAISLLDIENTNQNNTTYNHPLVLESNVTYGGDAVNISDLMFEMGESRGSGELYATLGDVKRFKGKLLVNSFNLDNFLSGGDDGTNTNNEEKVDYAFLDNVEGTFNFKLGALQFNEKIASQLDLDLNAVGGQLDITQARINMPGGSELSLGGSLSAPNNNPEFNGDITLNSGNFRAFLEWLKIDVSAIPEGRLTRLAYSGGIKADTELVQLYEIDGNLDTFQFNGGVSYAVQDRPSFGLDVSIADLNIDNYLEEPSTEPVNLKDMVGILGEFDANYKLNLANVTTQGVTVKKIDMAGELFGGKLNAKTINIEGFAGFDLNGSLIGSNLADNPIFETSFNTTAASLVALQRAYRFKTPYDIGQVGAVALNVRSSGDFEKIDIDIKSTIGTTKADVKGIVRSATLKQLPEVGSVDVTLSASNSSFASLIDQFDLPVTKAAASDDRPFGINTSVKGTKELVDLDGTLSIAGGNVALKGRTNFSNNEISTFDMAIDINGPHMREFVRALGVEFNPSNTDLGPLIMKMTASGTMTDIALNNITGALGPTKINGSGQINGLTAEKIEGQKTNFDFTFVLDDLPVQEFMEPETERPVGEDWGNWSKEPMELALLNDYEGRASITANRINYDTYNFENPRFDAVLKDGVINISNFTGKLFGGEVEVAGTFSSAGELDMDMSLKNAAIVDATTTFAGIKPISGYFDMTQKITGKGTSQDALISSLNGTGEINATPGIINGIDIPQLSERINELTNKNGVLGLLTATLSGGQTPYEGGASTITTKNGFIQLSPLDVKMLGAESDINLGINLAQWQMNMSGDMALSDHPDAPPIGISVLGDLHDPDIKYNTAQLEGFIGAKIASSLLQNMVEGNGGLGTLFGVPAAPDDTSVEGENVPATTSSAPGATETASSPFEDFIEPPTELPPPSPEEEPTPAPAPERQQETVEELGVKLLERLFQQPPPQN